MLSNGHMKHLKFWKFVYCGQTEILHCYQTSPIILSIGSDDGRWEDGRWDFSFAITLKQIRTFPCETLKFVFLWVHYFKRNIVLQSSCASSTYTFALVEQQRRQLMIVVSFGWYTMWPWVGVLAKYSILAINGIDSIFLACKYWEMLFL